MHSGPDSSAPPSSLTARRSAASNLPNFELPPPPLQALHNKYQPYAPITSQVSGNASSVGNLLTPPNTLGSDSHGVPSTFSPSGYWNQPTPGGSNYAYQPSSNSQWIPPRGLFSPASLNSFVRSNSSPAVPTEGTQYGEVQLPPFSSTLPGMTNAQQQHAMSMGMNSQGNNGNPQPTPIHMQESYGALRPPPTPTYFNQGSSTNSPSQNSFPFSSGPSPPIVSPLGSGGQQQQQHQHQPRMSPHGEMPRLHQTTSDPTGQFSRPYGQYSLPAMSGPAMSNLHSPNGQMSLVGNMSNPMMGGFNSGHAANMQQMYAMPLMGPASAPSNDRPFKCDQCVQSFNRNHDLKRHKRIHLAVKPFPCGHCDKSFSRKDALKRHILVKGCGKTLGTDPDPRADDSDSPVEKHESSGSPP